MDTLKRSYYLNVTSINGYIQNSLFRWNGGTRLPTGPSRRGGGKDHKTIKKNQIIRHRRTVNSSLTLQWTKRVSFPYPLHPTVPSVSAICLPYTGSWWTTAPRARQAQARVCCVCVCVCVWWLTVFGVFFWQLDVRDHVLFCLEEEGRILKAYVCSWSVKDSVLCAHCPFNSCSSLRRPWPGHSYPV